MPAAMPEEVHDERLDELRKRAEQAAARVSEEQTRLEKLWEAFKQQERDLQDTAERARRLEEDLRGKDDTASRLEQEIARRDDEIRSLSRENDALHEKVVELERRLEGLSEVEALRAQSDELAKVHAQDAERLAKLYALYEEEKAEREKLVRELASRDAWFDENRDVLKTVSAKLSWRGAMLKKKV
ncbi:MAG TPA: hypothetical protein VM681_00125 [Candidatus Thermoplasmatota archaeon]|nr:hypothetical protein [Candidatus Thermoplasmatota archaeon]